MMMRNGGPKAVFPELRGSKSGIQYPCFGEIKYDGEACQILVDLDAKLKVCTVNKYGTVRYQWPKLDGIAQILESKGVRRAVLFAELYYGSGTNGCLYELLSHKSDDALNLMIWDGFADKVQALTPLIDRKEWLHEVLPNAWLVKDHVITSNKDADIFMQDMVLKGFEGVVLKPFNSKFVTGPCDWVKMKHKDKNILKVSLVDPVKERIEVIHPHLIANGAITKDVHVGVKCCNRHKLGVKVGDMVEIEHQGVLASGSLRHPVFVGLV